MSLLTLLTPFVEFPGEKKILWQGLFNLISKRNEVQEFILSLLVHLALQLSFICWTYFPASIKNPQKRTKSYECLSKVWVLPATFVVACGVEEICPIMDCKDQGRDRSKHCRWEEIHIHWQGVKFSLGGKGFIFTALSATALAIWIILVWV